MFKKIPKGMKKGLKYQKQKKVNDLLRDRSNARRKMTTLFNKNPDMTNFEARQIVEQWLKDRHGKDVTL